jgi:predicted membrane channel-forming protein YqfA (hemolysin III family)
MKQGIGIHHKCFVLSRTDVLIPLIPVGLQLILWLFVPYLLGAAGLFFYLSRYPERLVPRGRVDLCGASHQIWHLLILAGQSAQSLHKMK